MKNQLKSCLVGYKKLEVEQYIQGIKKDYEEELCRKKDRMTELSEENRFLKQNIEELNERIARYAEQEKYVSRALVKAEQRAQAIIEDSQHKVEDEMYKIKKEKDKWKEKFNDIRSELLTFEQSVCSLMEKFRDEINYYSAKELSNSLLLEEEQEEEEDEFNKQKIKKVIA